MNLNYLFDFEGIKFTFIKQLQLSINDCAFSIFVQLDVTNRYLANMNK